MTKDKVDDDKKRFRIVSSEPSPRVLHILGELRSSGAECMLRIAGPSWFSAERPHAILATGPAEGPYAVQLKAAGFEVSHTPFRKRIGFFREVYALIRSGRFDAVHIHTEQANVYYGVVARLAGVRRIVHTIHNVFPYTGFLRVVRIAMRQGLRLLGATEVAVGPSVADNEERHLWNRTVVIPNWYDPAFRPPSADERAQARRAYGVLDNRAVIATIGNCSEVKNHSLLLHALKLMLQRRSDWLYLHAGEEDAEAKERILAVELNLAEQCSFLGRTDHPRSVLWAADVFVMPSTHEGLGIAAIEAAACGLPLVLTDVPGLRDLKMTLSDGFWVPSNPPAVADAIEAALFTFPSGSAKNASSVKAAFAMAVGAKAYYDLYAGVDSAGATANPYSRSLALHGKAKRLPT